MSQLHLQLFTKVAADSVSASECIDQSTALSCLSYGRHRQHVTLDAAHSVRPLSNMKPCLVVVPVAILMYSCNHLQALPSMWSWLPAACMLQHGHTHACPRCGLCSICREFGASTGLKLAAGKPCSDDRRTRITYYHAVPRCREEVHIPVDMHGSLGAQLRPQQLRPHCTSGAVPLPTACSVRSTLVNSRCSLGISTIELLPCNWLRPHSSHSKREWRWRSSRGTASCSASRRAAGDFSKHA